MTKTRIQQILGVLLSVFLTLQTPIPALAWNGEKPEIASVFCQKDTIYTFFDMGTETFDYVFVKQPGSFAYEQELRPLAETDAWIHCFFLVDHSGSVKPYQEQIQLFMAAVMDACQAESSHVLFTLATLGDAFCLTGAQNTMDAGKVMSELKQLPFSDQTTDLYQGISQALDYLEERNRTGRMKGEFIHLIVITDGEADQQAETPTRKEVRERILDRNDILVHIAGLSSPLGLCSHEYIAMDELEMAAKNIARNFRCLAAAEFALGQEMTPDTVLPDIEVYFNIMEKSRRLPNPPHLLLQNIQVLNWTEQQPEASASESISSIEETRKEETTQESIQETISVPATETTADSTEKSMQDGTLESIRPVAWILGALFGGAAVGAAAVGILLCRIKKREKRFANDSANSQIRKIFADTADSKDTIYMKLQVLSGHCLTPDREFYLKRELFIGTDASCDVIWEGADVSAKNSRIFRENGLIWIEDLDSEQGTFLGGMRLHAPNRLRSGDVVSIGDVEFRFLF
ncbi:MAG: FHA domain-containing protein [bacterium]|nr:FHA domain-containing protein [bacterium]